MRDFSRFSEDDFNTELLLHYTYVDAYSLITKLNNHYYRTLQFVLFLYSFTYVNNIVIIM